MYVWKRKSTKTWYSTKFICIVLFKMDNHNIFFYCSKLGLLIDMVCIFIIAIPRAQLPLCSMLNFISTNPCVILITYTFSFFFHSNFKKFFNENEPIKQKKTLEPAGICALQIPTKIDCCQSK